MERGQTVPLWVRPAGPTDGPVAGLTFGSRAEEVTCREATENLISAAPKSGASSFLCNLPTEPESDPFRNQNLELGKGPSRSYAPSPTSLGLALLGWVLKK